jgi:hypothetical protein
MVNSAALETHFLSTRTSCNTPINTTEFLSTNILIASNTWAPLQIFICLYHDILLKLFVFVIESLRSQKLDIFISVLLLTLIINAWDFLDFALINFELQMVSQTIFAELVRTPSEGQDVRFGVIVTTDYAKGTMFFWDCLTPN